MQPSVFIICSSPVCHWEHGQEALFQSVDELRHRIHCSIGNRFLIFEQGNIGEYILRHAALYTPVASAGALGTRSIWASMLLHCFQPLQHFLLLVLRRTRLCCVYVLFFLVFVSIFTLAVPIFGVSSTSLAGLTAAGKHVATA